MSATQTPGPTLSFNAALAAQFIAALTGSPDTNVTWQTFDDDDKRKSESLTQMFHGTLAGCAVRLAQLNASGAGIFVCVNETDLRGRKADNVVGLRALFVDSDTGPIPNERFALAPHFRVKTPQGEHAYFLLAPGEARDEFTPAQKQLISWFQSDKAVCDLPRVLRVPGSIHGKAAPTPIDQVWYGDISRRYTIAEVLRAYPRVRLVSSTTTPNILDGVASASMSRGLGYVGAALADAVRKISTAPEGSRNGTLNTEAFGIAQLVAGGELEHAPTWEALATAARTAGLVDTEIHATLTSAFAAGAREPRRAPAQVEPFTLDDTGNAERLVSVAKGTIKFVHTWNRWIAWDGKRWTVKGAESIVHRLVKKTIGSMVHEGKKLPPENPYKEALLGWAKLCRGKKYREAMVSLARHEEDVALDHEDLDAKPWLLNLKNGTLNLETAVLEPHDPKNLITKIARWDYKPDATCPLFQKFLLEVMAGDQEMAAYIQRAFGYSLTGFTIEHCMFFLHGVGNRANGRNGKSTLVGLLLKLLGDYAIVGAPNLLLAKQGESHPTELAALHGARVVVCAEVEDGRAWAESLIKTLTGDGTASVRRMREDFWVMEILYKLWVHGNHKPSVKGTDDGIWSRFRLVPFTITFEGAKKDKKLLVKLTEEMEGILAWAVRGCLDWQKNELGEPALVREATQAYRTEQDLVGAFLAEFCVLDPRAQTKRSDLRRAYDLHCEQLGQKAVIGAKRFAEGLREKGVTEGSPIRTDAPDWIWRGKREEVFGFSRPSTPERCWAGIRIKTEEELINPPPTIETWVSDIAPSEDGGKWGYLKEPTSIDAARAWFDKMGFEVDSDRDDSNGRHWLGWWPKESTQSTAQ